MELFEHNRIAYESAEKMLEERGRAAAIHPTGTGKSFIAFRLCEEHPSSRVCWLSPSEYIYRTQVENLVQAGGKAPENVLFYTYAKLMLLSDGELKAIRPEYIVLDEFHRCGAEMWGQGVRRLLEIFPEAKVLGLSATNIRYLDNCRDIDKAPHIYKAYSEDPETSRAFAAFKADESEHLKLLFCIDMLNEGVHVEGVAG